MNEELSCFNWSCYIKINDGLRKCVYFICIWTILSVFIKNLGCKELDSILYVCEWNIMHYLYYVSSGLNGQWSLYLLLIGIKIDQNKWLSYFSISFDCYIISMDLIMSIQDNHLPAILINE